MDVVIVGSGISGLFCAYKLSKFTKNILVISKGSINLSNSYWAQGGIAVAIGSKDSLEFHYRDTIKAGDGLCDEERVKKFVHVGKEVVLELINEGAPFDRDNDEIGLSIEGGHSVARIIHSGGIQTGKNLTNYLIQSLKEVNFLENTKLLGLIVKNNRVYGVILQRDNEIFRIYSKFVVLATGGASGLYLRTTNPYTATGDAMFIAYKSGLTLENLEFIQFHPTVFFAPDNSRILISEAIRGDGAILLNEKGERFIDEKETRDKVSRAIVLQNKVYLYAGNIDKGLILEKYSYLYNLLKFYGYDLTKDKIPIKPSAHYFIGGIKSNLDGTTEIKNLYTIGEVSSTRIHGANRLASNSLLECLVMAKLCAMDISKKLKRVKLREIYYNENIESYVVSHEERELLDRYCFIIRDGDNLKRALKKIKNENLIKYIFEFALRREESRGVHYRIDFPNKDDKFLCYFQVKRGEITLEKKKT
ncbi:MAG: FAD-dependent oxidoreductase [candidate division WOR-3 bacterium]|nr:FAD-dependent oxidoreductase [candidate division WOR-3 bacterium]MDW8150104.1 FAD-dependent oxidoreductase [candidate division WOR-3 bacterium]